MRKLLITAGMMMLALSAVAQPSQPGTKEQPVAIIQTSMGDLHCALFPKAAPIGTASFIGLAKGTKDWRNPKTTKTMHGVPLYDNTTFHRVIPEFMIQGGDPKGTGNGDVGFNFRNETQPNLTFDQPGRLAYANTGQPSSNGSQFFVTEVATHFLDGKYTIFGQCDAASVELVKKIARVKRDSNDKPFTPVIIKHIKIDEGGAATAAKKPVAAKKKAVAN